MLTKFTYKINGVEFSVIKSTHSVFAYNTALSELLAIADKDTIFADTNF
jgi:hypothetical protein